MITAIKNGKQESVDYYNKWVEEVKNTVPSEKLLIFSVKDGWEPLCKFLDVPIQDGPFPNTNDTKMMKQRMMFGKIMAYFLVFGVPLLIALFLYYFMS